MGKKTTSTTETRTKIESSGEADAHRPSALTVGFSDTFSFMSQKRINYHKLRTMFG